jgi:hypothetical protein
LNNEVVDLSEAKLRANFRDVWPKFLEFQISRSKRCVEVAGSVNGYLVLQVIAYHNLSLINSTTSVESYEQARNAWELGWSDTLLDLPYILNFAAISALTGLDKETARRAVLKLEKNGWVTVDKKLGITYSPSDENQRLLLELNEWELGFLGRLIALTNAPS